MDAEQEIGILRKKIELLELELMQKQKSMIKDAVREAMQEHSATKTWQRGLESEFIRKFHRNKRDLIKQKIVERIKASPISLADLKYAMVDQLGYCSKASFYRHFKSISGMVDEKNSLLYVKQEVLH